jgi:hypothetical protein
LVPTGVVVAEGDQVVDALLADVASVEPLPISAVSSRTTPSESIMERKRQSQKKANVRDDRGKVRLERSYGEIGISAVAAAVEPHGNRRRKPAPDRVIAKHEEPKK